MRRSGLLQLRLQRSRSRKKPRFPGSFDDAFARDVINSLPHEIAVIDANGTVIAVNRKWERFALENGADPKRVSIGSNYLLVCDAAADKGDPYASEALARLGALIRGENREFSMVYPCNSPTQKRWFLMYAARSGASHGALVISHTDITAQVLAEAALLEATGRLREADRRKDEFLATLAHELRNPLAPIVSGLYVLQNASGRAHADRDMKLIEMMKRQAEHLTCLVDDLLDVSRITRGKVELKKQIVDLREILEHALETARPSVDRGGHILTVTLPDSPLLIDADPVRLAQVFTNLINNAAKYTEHGGRIAVTAELEGADAVITVQDSGVGIPAEMLPRVFDLFTQVDRTLGRAEGGLGIGLALVRRLIELHGGCVSAHSAGRGQGSQFIVRLHGREWSGS